MSEDGIRAGSILKNMHGQGRGGADVTDSTRLHGVNLTGWLMLASWVTPELFADSGTLNERDLARVLGPVHYRDLIGAHRRSYITQEDFQNIADRGFNAVRLPVPWYVFGDKGPAPGPYVGCLGYIDDALAWAQDAGLKVLLVLGVSPGEGQFEDDLMSASQLAQKHRNQAISLLCGLARRYRSQEAFLGIELADDPVPQKREGLFHMSAGVPLHILRNYYRMAYEAIRNAAGADVLIVLPDAGVPDAWDLFLARSHAKTVWLDCHLYQYLDDLSKTATVDARSLVRRSEKSLDRARRSGLPVMVGKWSAALPYSDTVTTPEGRIALERVYVSEQLSAYKDCPAWFFQTWKTSGRLPNWDARIAHSSFERRLLD